MADEAGQPGPRKTTTGGGAEAPGYAAVLRFYLPLCFTSMANVSTHSIVNAGLARTADPTVTLAAYGVARSVLLMIDSFLQAIRPATVALIRNESSYQMVRKAVAFQALLMMVGIVLTAVTPVGTWLFESVLGVAAPVAAGARLAMAFFIPVLAIIAWRSFQQGMLIANKVTSNVLVGALSRPILSAVLISALLPLGNWLPGVVIGATAFVAVILVEGSVLNFLIRRHRYSWSRVFPSNVSGPAIGYRAIVAFLVPLLVQTYLKTITQPVLDASMARGLNPTVSLAVFAVCWQFARMFVGPANMVHQVSLVLGRDEDARGVCYRTSVGIGVVLTGVLAGLSIVHGTGLIFRILFALPPDLEPLAEQVVLAISPVPLITAWREYYWGLLLLGGKTGLIGTGKTVGLAITAAAALLGVAYVPVAGAIVAGAAMTIGELAESVVVVWYARRADVVQPAVAA